MTQRRLLVLGFVAIGLLGFASGAFLVSQLALRQQAADHATLASHEATIASLRAQSARLDTVWLVKQDTFRLYRQRWDTLRTVERFTDTLIHRDTVRMVIAVADSTIRACTSLVETCEDQKAVLRSRVVAESTAVQALSRQLSRARIRSRLGCTVGPSVTEQGVSYIGASCGLRVF